MKTYTPDLDPAVLGRLLQARGDLTMLPPATLKLDLSLPIAPKPVIGRPI